MAADKDDIIELPKYTAPKKKIGLAYIVPLAIVLFAFGIWYFARDEARMAVEQHLGKESILSELLAPDTPNLPNAGLPDANGKTVQGGLNGTTTVTAPVAGMDAGADTAPQTSLQGYHQLLANGKPVHDARGNLVYLDENGTPVSVQPDGTVLPFLADGQTNAGSNSTQPVDSSPTNAFLDPDGKPLVFAEDGSPLYFSPDGQLLPQAPKVQSDAKVQQAFIEDLARWLVSRYQPARPKGRLNVTAQSLNMRYGVNMTGLDWNGNDLYAGRTALFRYAFTPTMMDALYALYIDRFMDAFALAASSPRGKAGLLNSAQTADMYTLYAGSFRIYGHALEGLAKISDLSARLAVLDAAVQRTVETHTQLTEAIFVLDQARAQKSDEHAMVQQQVDALGSLYKQAIAERGQSRDTLVTLIRKNVGRSSLDDETLLFLASWINRRNKSQENVMPAVQSSAALLENLAQRFDTVAASLR